MVRTRLPEVFDLFNITLDHVSNLFGSALTWNINKGREQTD